ncbi:response regulator transcription factor [Thalassospira profundimaris]|uniref:Response regulatory domain-containing protein n=1 Tax=Thalassospira profundimaris TaxID=502049 RepID=A0A367WRR9_9PROT|nr:response regulator transcription factor [Thalassospira profundimaris]RCK43251.1 hypothetical protein TH30_19760 [Thalassospira profundimaris]
MKQVLIVDDDNLIREYLARSAYDLFGDCEVFSTSTLKDALGLDETIRPETILFDLILPDTQGLTGLRSVRRRWKESCIIVISGSSPGEDQIKEMKMLANGFLAKSNHHLSQLATAIHRIEKGTEEFELLPKEQKAVEHSFSCLSPVESQVFQLFDQGLSVRDVLAITGKSESTVKSIRRNIRAKLGDNIFGDRS